MKCFKMTLCRRQNANSQFFSSGQVSNYARCGWRRGIQIEVAETTPFIQLFLLLMHYKSWPFGLIFKTLVPFFFVFFTIVGQGQFHHPE
jgi:hypothetical protein